MKRLHVVAVVTLVAMFSCAPIRIAAPVRGVVVDSETGEPIPHALVEVSASTRCTAFADSTTRTLQAAQSESDASGRFRAGGGLSLLFPLCAGWSTRVAAAAAGYYATADQPVEDSIGLGIPWPAPYFEEIRVPLYRMRYLLPLRYYGRNHAYTGAFEKSGISKSLEAAIASLAYQRVGKPGVFVRTAGERFDRIFSVHNTVYARSSIDGAAWAWKSDGRRVTPTPPSASYIRNEVEKGMQWRKTEDALDRIDMLTSGPLSIRGFPRSSQCRIRARGTPLGGLVLEHQIGALPVVGAQRKLVGMISAVDMLRAFHDSGAG